MIIPIEAECAWISTLGIVILSFSVMKSGTRSSPRSSRSFAAGLLRARNLSWADLSVVEPKRSPRHAQYQNNSSLRSSIRREITLNLHCSPLVNERGRGKPEVIAQGDPCTPWETGPAALDDPPAHHSDVVIHQCAASAAPAQEFRKGGVRAARINQPSSAAQTFRSAFFGVR
jgi:hypothetical protein